LPPAAPILFSVSPSTAASPHDVLEPSDRLLIAVSVLLSFVSAAAGFLHVVPFDDGTWAAAHEDVGHQLAILSAILHVALPGAIVATLARRRGWARAFAWGGAAALMVVGWYLVILVGLFTFGCAGGHCGD